MTIIATIYIYIFNIYIYTQEGLAAIRSSRRLCNLIGGVGRATGSGGFDVGEEEMTGDSPKKC